MQKILIFKKDLHQILSWIKEIEFLPQTQMYDVT